MKPGVYSDLSNADYHGGPGISKSGLDLIAKSPAHYYHAVHAVNDNERVPTPAQAFGTAFHTLLLEPHLFGQEYAVELTRDAFPCAIDSRDQLVEIIKQINATRLPKLSMTGGKDELINRICEHNPEFTPAGLQDNKTSELKYILEDMNKSRDGLYSTGGSMSELVKIASEHGFKIQLWSDIKKQFEEEHQGQKIISTEVFKKLIDMRDAVLAHPAARYLLSLEGEAEQSVYWEDKTTHTLCRIRPDFWAPKHRIIADLKTTNDASAEAFARSAMKWRYHVQDAMYCEGAKAATGLEHQFYFIVVEDGACVVNGTPKGVAVYQLDEISRDAGALEFRKNLNEYVYCSEMNKWPGYPGEVQQLQLPSWGLRNIEMEYAN